MVDGHPYRNGLRMEDTTEKRLAALLIVMAASWLAGVATASPPNRASIDEAIGNLGSDHDRAVAAAHALRAGGADAAEAIREAWPSLSPLAQRRAIAPLRSLAESHAAAVEALVAAARSRDEGIQGPALEALAALPGRGRDGLAALLEDRSSTGDRAAQLLARSEPDFAIEALLSAMAEPGGENRPGVRDALAVAVERAESPDSVVRAWLSASPPAAAAASAAVGVSGLEGREALVARLVTYALPSSDQFETAWRLLRSASGAGESPSIDRWVQKQLSEPDEWMLRAAAVEAAAARGPRENTRPQLRDPYPRVRLAAASVLAGDQASLIERATLARRDAWPMVRAAAVTSLRNEPDALPVIIASIDDSMSAVRAAAIEALIGAPHDDGWERIHARLRATEEWTDVTAAAIGYVVAHCRTDATESLFRVVMRAAPSNAPTEDLNNAARAVEALRALGSPEAEAVIDRLRDTPDVPPTLKMALDRPLGKAAACPRPEP